MSKEPGEAPEQEDKKQSSNEQFSTTVTGGFVGYIVNAARGAVVNIRASIFGDVKQVIVFFGIVIVVGSVIGYGIWRTRQPFVGDPDDFYIAIAEFEQISATADAKIAPVISQQIFDYLDTQFQLQDFDIPVVVVYKNIGVVEGGNEARELANKINADLVIFGTVTVTGNSLSITPKFYVAETIRPDISELTGTHQLTIPITSSLDNSSNIDQSIGDELRDRSAILIDFTKSLTYLAANNRSANKYSLDLSLESIRSAIQTAETYGKLKDCEVLYLFASHISRLAGNLDDSQLYVDKALSIDPNYGRAFIAQANIYYDKQDLDNALKYYEAALALDKQPANYRLYEKAHLGIGNILTYQFQIAPPEEKDALAEQAFFHLTEVINSYLEEKRSIDAAQCQEVSGKEHSISNKCEENIKITDMAAHAYYASGIIYQHQQKVEPACTAFQTAMGLTISEDLIRLAKSHIEIIGCPSNN